MKKKLVKPLRESKRAEVRLYAGESCTNVGCKGTKVNGGCLNLGCSTDCKYC